MALATLADRRLRATPEQLRDIGAIAHRLCRLIWLVLHQGVRYDERGPAVSKRSNQKRTTRMIRELRALGYRVEVPNFQTVTSM